MKKQDLLDICNDIQILSKGCQVLKNVKTSDEFLQAFIRIGKSIKNTKIYFNRDLRVTDLANIQFYDVLIDNESTVGDFIILDCRCWFCLETHQMLINQLDYKIRINKQIIYDVEDAIVLINSMNDKDECDE